MDQCRGCISVNFVFVQSVFVFVGRTLTADFTARALHQEANKDEADYYGHNHLNAMPSIEYCKYSHPACHFCTGAEDTCRWRMRTTTYSLSRFRKYSRYGGFASTLVSTLEPAIYA